MNPLLNGLKSLLKALLNFIARLQGPIQGNRPKFEKRSVPSPRIHNDAASGLQLQSQLVYLNNNQSEILDFNGQVHDYVYGYTSISLSPASTEISSMGLSGSAARPNDNQLELTASITTSGGVDDDGSGVAMYALAVVGDAGGTLPLAIGNTGFIPSGALSSPISTSPNTPITVTPFMSGFQANDTAAIRVSELKAAGDNAKISSANSSFQVSGTVAMSGSPSSSSSNEIAMGYLAFVDAMPKVEVQVVTAQAATQNGENSWWMYIGDAIKANFSGDVDQVLAVFIQDFSFDTNASPYSAPGFLQISIDPSLIGIDGSTVNAYVNWYASQPENFTSQSLSTTASIVVVASLK